MIDQFGRMIDYMRISVTDRCNLRCKYCMPDGISLISMAELLTLEEIAETARAATVLGIRHIKLTGGEPLVRRGITDLVAMLKDIEGIEKVTLTTNGILLEQMLPKLLEAGLDAVNISVDTLDPDRYQEITGTDALSTVLSAIESACRAGLLTKVNAVSLDLGEENLRSLISLAKDKKLDVRFIEMMPIGLGKQFPVISHRALYQKLQEMYPGMRIDRSQHGFGPAVYYQIPGYQGSVGLISAIHGKFCDSCNRVRLTSQGYLKTCLCYHQGADLREILRSDLLPEKKEEQLIATIRETIRMKPQAHCFDQIDQMTEAANMNAIGG